MSMNNFLKSLLVALLVTSSALAVSTTWTGGAGTSDWFTGANWDTGNAPVAGDWTLIVNVTPPLMAPVINSSISNTAGIEVGDGTRQGTLYIQPGAEISLATYNYNRLPANGVVYQSGGSVSCNSNTWLSRNTSGGMNSLLEITGGSFTILRNRTFTWLNRRTDAQARINVFGGTFANNGSWRVTDSTYYPAMDATWGASIKNGGIFVHPWTQAQTTGYITSSNQNLKSADPKQGLSLKWAAADTSYQTGGQYNPYYLTATTVYGMACPLLPLSGAATAPGATDLKWLNTTAFYDGANIARYVRFGTYAVDVNGLPTDPNGDNLPIVAGPLATDSNYVVTCVYGDNYQWRIDTVDDGIGNGDANFPKTIKSRAMYVVCRNQAPVVTIPTTATTPIGLRGGTVAWSTTATATDDGLPIGGPALTYSWSQVGGPAVPGLPTAPAANGALSVNMTAANTYTFRCSVYDSDLTGTADVAVTVYANVCEASKVRTGYTAAQGDINADCWVSFLDAALVAENWLTCNSLEACY